MNSQIQCAYEQFCIERFAIPSRDDVNEREATIGVPLPADYKRYLLEYNGGCFDYPEIDVSDPDCPVSPALDVMCGVGAPDEGIELGNKSDLLLFDDNDPVRILIIGHTLDNHLILLDVDAESESHGGIWLKTIDISPDYEGGGTTSLVTSMTSLGFCERLRSSAGPGVPTVEPAKSSSPLVATANPFQ